MKSVWLLNQLLKRKMLFVAIMLWSPIFCLMWVLPLKTNRCTYLHTNKIKKSRERLLSQSLHLGLILGIWMDLSLFLLANIVVWSVILDLNVPCWRKNKTMLLDPLLKTPSGPKQIVCHHCGAFGHLRSHCSKFQALKRIKIKENLELRRSCAMKTKSDLGKNCVLSKQILNALTSLSMCISSSHSSNPCLSSFETLTPNNCFV